MKVKFKIICIKIIWILSRIFCVFPLQENKIIFLSYDGKQYSDSPKYISDYILLHDSNMKIVWAFEKNIDVNNYNLNNKITRCYKGTPSYLYHLFTSKEIVVNDFISTLFRLRKGQILLNTWHGGGTFKTIGMSRKHITEYDPFFYKAHALNTSAYLLSSEYFKETVVTRSFLFYGEVIPSGLPRNANLFRNNIEEKEKVYKKFDISSKEEVLLVLYAPTYRNYTVDCNIEDELLDLKKCKNAFKARYNKNVIFLNRSHHIMSKAAISGNYKDATNYPDMQELIAAADVLISDYSSCIWDFSLTRKPVFIYAPDLNVYEENIDFFMPVREWPFPLASNNEELIENVEKFNLNIYLSELEKYMKPLKSYEGPNSIKIACDWLEEKRKESV